jgi:putative ABC transport system ATP-binding protein
MRTANLDENSRLTFEGGQQGASSPAAVGIEAVTKRYGTKRYGSRKRGPAALREVSVEFPRTSFSAVMGLSGSGKSTLLQVAAGLDRPTSGTVRLGGTDLSGLSRRQLSVLRRQQVGFVFQAFNLVPSLSVAENIALPLRLDHRRVDRHHVQQVAERVGIAGELRRLPGTLSGGQQQRVAIARALVTSPEVIFADEPTAALDPYTSEVVVSLLRQAVDDLGRTVVVVTHEPTVAAYADRVLLLDRGCLVGVVEAPSPGELAARLRHLGEAHRSGADLR